MRKKENFNDDWKFKLQEGFTDASLDDFDDSSWHNINLPHDWSIYFDFDHNSPAQNEGGLLNGGTGWYRKSFTLEEEYTNKSIRLRFGGIYMDSTVYVNGEKIGNYPNGYTPFSYDITDFLKPVGEKNLIAVKVVNKQPSSRWYSGSGIYRDVHLISTNKNHIKEYGTYIQTPFLKEEVGKDVTVKIETKVNTTNNIDLKHSVLTKDNQRVKTYDQRLLSVDPIDNVLYSSIKVKQPKLWSINSPTLYILKTEMYIENQLVDTVYERFGFRYIDWTPENGFELNGKYIKMHGVSMHHDQGALGAIANYSAMYRQIRILKDMGVNAIRSTHNPADDKLIKIVENMGMLLIEESFDTWYEGKKEYDYGRFFEKQSTHPDAIENQTWAEYDIKQMVERGKNSPSIIMWSIGNEISESKSGDKKAVETARNLNKWVKEVDKTRYTTMGQDAYRWGVTGGHEKISNEIDAVGLNYAEDNYEEVQKNHPEWLIYGAETASATTSRGVYAFPDEIRIHDDKSIRRFQQSDYGNDRVGWGKTASNAWKPDRDNKGYAGQFIWTGFDYIGEPTPWHNQNDTPPKSSYFGIIDTAGFPKNSYYLYQSQWVSVEKNPMVHIYPHWNWEDEKLLDFNMRTSDNKIPVRVYSNALSVELFLNGQSVGEQKFSKKKTNYGVTYQENKINGELYLEWRLNYEPGELLAIAKNEEGSEVARDVIKTAGKPKKVELIPESNVILANGKDLSYIKVSVKDDKDIENPIAENMIKFTIDGPGRIVGVDNGDPASNERYKMQRDGSWQRKLFSGKAILIVQSTKQEGQISITAESKGLKQCEIDVYSRNNLNQNKILRFEKTSITTDYGIIPELPEYMKALMGNGTIKKVQVNWDKVQHKDLFDTNVNEVIVEGEIPGSNQKPTIKIYIRKIDKIIKPYIYISKGKEIELPKKLKIVYTDGDITEIPVNWEKSNSKEKDLNKPFNIKGVAIHLGQKYDVVAVVSIINSDVQQKTKKTNIDMIEIANKKINIKADKKHYSIKLKYHEKHSDVHVSFTSKTNLQMTKPNKENNYMMRIFETSPNIEKENMYTLNLNLEEPKLEFVHLNLSENKAFTDTKIKYSVEGLLEDKSSVFPNDMKMEWYIQPKKGIEIIDDEIFLYKSGVYSLKVSGEYNGKQVYSKQQILDVKPNLGKKTIKELSRINIKTKRNELPKLPNKVLAKFNRGFDENVLVNWEEISNEQISNYGEFVITGNVKDTTLQAKAMVKVIGVIGVESFSTATPLNKMPELPKTCEVYYSDRSSDHYSIEWDSIDSKKLTCKNVFKHSGKIKSLDIKTTITIRVSDQINEGKNIAQQWTGSSLPAGIASYTSKEPQSKNGVANLNDKIISFDVNDDKYWSNKSQDIRKNDWVGILFADAGTIKQRYVDNFNIAFLQDKDFYLPENYVIEFYQPASAPTLPENFGQIEHEESNSLNDNSNWIEVTGLKYEDLKSNQFNQLIFDGVNTYAIRLRMKAKKYKSLAITEVEVYDRITELYGNFEAYVTVNGKMNDSIDLNKEINELEVTNGQTPEIEIESTNNAASTILYNFGDQKTIKIKVVSENKLKTLESLIILK